MVMSTLELEVCVHVCACVYVGVGGCLVCICLTFHQQGSMI